MEAPSASPVAVQPQTPPPVDDLPEAALKAAAQANTSTDAQAATADLTTDSNSATATTTTADVPIAEDWHVPEAVTETGGYEDDVEDQVEDQDEDVGTTEQPGASAPTTEQQGAEQEQEQEQEEQEPKPSAPEPHEPPEKRPHVTPPTPPPEREAPLKLAQLMPACWHRPFLSLNVDGALAARVPEDVEGLLFWHDAAVTSTLLFALLTAYALLMLDLGISAISLLCLAAKVALLMCGVAVTLSLFVDKLILKHSPPRNVVEIYIGAPVRRAYSTAEACLPSREELLRGVDLVLESAPRMVCNFGALCRSGNWRRIAPAVLTLHVCQHIFRYVTPGGLYLLTVLFAFSIPVAYRKRKAMIDGAICPVLEKTRAVVVSKMEGITVPSWIVSRLGLKAKSEKTD